MSTVLGVSFEVYGSGNRTPDAERAGDAVLKSPGPHGRGVIALLNHLADAGFAGAPRVVGDGYADDGRLSVTYVPGSSPHPRAWPSPASAGRVGALLRDLHEATASFVPPPGVRWRPTALDGLGTPSVVGHRDTGPWNIVDDGGVLRLIDWELAGPVDPLWELAETVWLNAHLVDDDIAALHGLPSPPDRAAHAKAILDGYGLDDRAGFVDRLVDVAAHGARFEAVQESITQESTDAVTAGGYPVMWAVTWRARSASWIARHRELLKPVLETTGR